MKHCTASARVRLLALPLVQPHPPPRLHQRCLCRCVRGLQRAPEGGVLGAGEPVGSVTLQCRELPTRPERSRAVSLVTSFGSCGPIYGSLILCPKTVEKALAILLHNLDLAYIFVAISTHLLLKSFTFMSMCGMNQD
jgi:hypothetical protein